jgi:molybdenum cofactor guanylyltransferase
MTKRHDIVGAILAGGRGSRIGGNKASVLLGGISLAAQATKSLKDCDAIAIVGDEGVAKQLGVASLHDPNGAPDGPLSGVWAALEWAKDLGAAYLVTLPCDMPFLPDDIALRLVMAAQGARKSVACARSDLGLEPLVTAWQVDVMQGVLAGELSKGIHPPVNRLLRAQGTAELSLSAQEVMNINTPDDLQQGEILRANQARR